MKKKNEKTQFNQFICYNQIDKLVCCVPVC